jgi:succinyl-CoA synthetase beta subunit
MDLLEYQAKALFQEVGIPTLPSQRIDRPTDIKFLKIPYPVVLKSQVSVGNRGKVGGVRFVENTIDGIAAAQTMFNLPIFGEVPQVLLAEAKYAASREFYLAVLIDYRSRRPVLLGSEHGGMDLVAVMDSLQQVTIEDNFSPFYARKLAIKMGLSGNLLLRVSNIIESMYRLMIAHDLELVEINPLGVSQNGELMALDGKVTANDRAIIRHPYLQNLSRQSNTCKQPKALATGNGRIGILAEGRGLALATVAELQQADRQIFQCWPINRLSQPEIIEVLQNMSRKIDVLLVKCRTMTKAIEALATLDQHWSATLVLDLPPNLLATVDLAKFSPVVVSNLAAGISAISQATVEAVETVEQNTAQSNYSFSGNSF